ncbi:hypothetical protein RJT34_01564 [Clitoria ternatea]|uniref:Mediator complex subunit 15 KIX domain-containing protein n=1 Tax=Clitoria ternatea TaxID=43366 RepID=A0AAN9PYL0_CLITE
MFVSLLQKPSSGASKALSTEAIVASLGVTLPNSLSGLVKNVERFEEKVYTVAKDEVDYTAMLSAKVKAIQSRAKIAESNACLSNSSRIDEPFPAQEAGKSASTEWKEQVHVKRLG